MIAMPDLGSFTPVPWKPGSAGSPATSRWRARSGRTVRGRSCATSWSGRGRWATQFKIGWSSSTSCCARPEDGGIELADPLDTLEQPCYDIRALTRQYDFVSELSRYVNSLGWGSYANDHEDANGQFEQNFEFADALTTADRAIFFRYMVQAMAQERGLIATFMPKPFGHLTGNGGHFHMSLWDGEADEPVRPTTGRPARPRPVGAGLSLHRRAEEARQGLHRAHRADRQQLQAA